MKTKVSIWNIGLFTLVLTLVSVVPAHAISLPGDFTLVTGAATQSTFSLDAAGIYTAWNLTFPAEPFLGLPAQTFMSPSPVPTTNIVGNNLGPISVLQFGTVTTGAYGIVVRHNDQGAVVRYLLGGTRVVKDTTYAPIPVPSTMLLFGTGLAGLGLWRYRKSMKG